ncbi:MAG: V-type ATP synthase subunit K [Clostridia bacterium]|nr:V-type ATP synthase subunit K [Clostridia bacterium]
MGYAISLIGIAACVLLCGVGSCIGLFKTSTAAAGVLGEDPKKFGKVMVLVLLPATQGIYGFIIGIIASGSIAQTMTTAMGWAMVGAVLPMALSGLLSAYFQGKAAANCIYAVGKQESLSGKLIVYPGMIEFYAILGLIISIMLLGNVGGLIA